jgi:glycosyltransferase involved in cell wall biosynthesis
MKISLIVPTYNRVEYLKGSLPSFVNQSLNKDDYEILIIDNNSNDDTKEISKSILEKSNCNWKYFFEANQGLHYARNRGILEAKGELIVFGDDDIEASQDWLSEFVTEFEQNKKTGVAGGKILPKWDKQAPEWIYDYGDSKTHAVFAYLDLGNKRKVLNNLMVFGCNFAIRKKIANEIGGSFPDTFPKRLKHLSGQGETEMLRQTMKLGYDIVYLPEAFIKHHAESKRATLDYFIDRHERWAIEDIYKIVRDNKRYLSRLALFISVTRQAIKEVKKIKPISKTSINPAYKKKILYAAIKAKIKQMFRLLWDKKLYNYILKDNYLDEIK